MTENCESKKQKRSFYFTSKSQLQNEMVDCRAQSCNQILKTNASSSFVDLFESKGAVKTFVFRSVPVSRDSFSRLVSCVLLISSDFSYFSPCVSTIIDETFPAAIARKNSVRVKKNPKKDWRSSEEKVCVRSKGS